MSNRFTDTEGNYSNKSGKISASFKVTQKSHFANVLMALKEFFGCGVIYSDNKKFDALKFQISNKNIIKSNVNNNFHKYPLISSKNLDYLDFKPCIELLDEKDKNLDAIISIKKEMNKGRSDIERFNYFSSSLPIHLNGSWLQGFIDAEGCFYCYMGNSNTYLNTLEISKSYHEIKLLEAIKVSFDSGVVKPKYDTNGFNELKKKL